MKERNVQMLDEMAQDLTFTSRGGGYGGGGHGGGGYGGGGYGGGGYGTAEYVDPYVVLASLGFGVFLFNLLFNILNRTTRSLDVEDINLPLELSDRPEMIHFRLDNVLSNSNEGEESSSSSSSSSTSTSTSTDVATLVKHSWLMAESIRKDPAACSKPLVCQLSGRATDDESIAWRRPSHAHRAVQLYVTWLAHHYGVDLARYVDQLEAAPISKTECAALPDGCRNHHLMRLL